VDIKQLTGHDLQALVTGEIVEVRGVSGIVTTVETAKRAPCLCRVHAMSGKTYDLVAYNEELDMFNVEEVR